MGRDEQFDPMRSEMFGDWWGYLGVCPMAGGYVWLGAFVRLEERNPPAQWTDGGWSRTREFAEKMGLNWYQAVADALGGQRTQESGTRK